MPQIATFELPRWVESFKATTKHDLSGSAAPSLSIDDLIALSSEPEVTRSRLKSLNSMKLSYGVHEGEVESRDAIAELYAQPEDAHTSKITRDDVLVTNGASGANQIILQSLISPSDHVICVYPTYGQLYEVPRAIGAEVSLWRLRPEDGWHLSMGDLRSLIRDGKDGRTKTRMIIINNPNNPTGAVIANNLQQQIIEFAKKHDIIVFSDEVFRPFFHATDAGEETIKSVLDHHSLEYDNVITSGSISKAYGLPGLRTGWVVSRSKALIHACAQLRDYAIAFTTPMAETVVAEALSSRCRPKILEKNHERGRECLDILEDFLDHVDKYAHWEGRPDGSSTLLLRFFTRDGYPVDDIDFCKRLHQSERVLFAPASTCFSSGASESASVLDDNDGLREQSLMGYVRCHFVRDPKTLESALTAIDDFIESGEYGEIQKAPIANASDNNGIGNGIHKIELEGGKD